MTTDELAKLLARITVLDNRQVDRLTLEAWTPIVGELDYQDALDAVNEHFRTSDRYLLPVHIVTGAAAAKRRRLTRPPHIHTVVSDAGYCSCGIRDTDFAA